MSAWLQIVLGACALMLTIAQLIDKRGQRTGSSDRTLADQGDEIKKLRAWHHKIGEDPADALGKVVDIHVAEFERRLARLESKVFNGSGVPR